MFPADHTGEQRVLSHVIAPDRFSPPDRGSDGEGGDVCPRDGDLPGGGELGPHGGLHRHER